MRAWSAFYPDILPSIMGKGFPNPLVDHHTRRATQQFCEIARPWTVKLDPIYTNATGLEYDLDLPRDTELVGIHTATLNGRCIKVWKEGDREVDPQHVYSPDGVVVALRKATGNDEPMPLVLEVSLKPGDTATGVEDFIAKQHAQLIARGAVANLLGDSGLQEAFEAGCRKQFLKRWRSNATDRPRPHAHYF